MLTDRKIATFTTGRRVDLPDEQVPGLALRVTPAGAKTWAVRYRVGGGRAGRLRRLTLGTYPRMKLQKARKEAMAALRAVDGGADPATEKRTQRLGETVGDLAKDYIEKYAKKFKKSWPDDDRMLNAEVLPHWKARKVRELTRRDVRQLIEAIAERGSPITANRCLALVRKMLNFAIEQDWIEANVASLIQRPGQERSRDRVLNDDEIRMVWEACADERPAMCALMRLRLVTAQRGGELASITWNEIDGAWLTLRAAATKNKRAHRVYLTKLAREILATVPRVHDEWVFAGRTDRAPMGDAKKAGSRIGARVLEALQADDATVETFDFRAHDLRRTAATRMAESGIAQSTIAKVLNHAEGGPRATQVYNRYEYDREKQVALETWSRDLRRILSRLPKSSTVVDIARRQA